jgi:hypothetical protein
VSETLLGDRIEEAIMPIVGTVLASVSVDLEAKRIGKTRMTLLRSDLSVISDNLEDALRLVVGAELAKAAAQRVRDLP